MTEHCELTEKELASLTDAQVVLALKGHYPVGNSSSEQMPTLRVCVLHTPRRMGHNRCLREM
jgi:hypothetical protein